jgi:PST family polysaccharide transporter
MSIAKKAVRGAAWTISTSVITRGLGLVGTLLLIRYLVPEDYGEVAAASIVVLTASQVSTFGVGMYVIANPKAGRDVVFHATVWHVLSGALAIGTVVLLRRPLGPLFDAPTMYRFVPGMALSVFLDRVSFMPERVMVRDLRFGTVGIMRSVGELGYTTVSTGLAMAGFGGMSIVYGNIVRSLLRLALTTGSTARRDWLEPHPIRKKTLWELVSYGFSVSIGAAAAFASRRWDNLLVSRFFGASVMGAYTFAYNLADIPAVQVGEQITDVLLASYAHIEKEKRTDALVRSTMLLGLIMTPLAVGLGATAPSIVTTFFPHKWAEVGPMLMLLSVLSVPRPIAGGLGAYMQATNRPRAVMWLECFSLVVLVGGICTLGRLGPRWTCVAVGVAFTVRALANMWLLRETDGIPISRMLGKLAPPLVACVPMVAVVMAVRHGARALGWPPALSLGLETAAGGLTYLISAFVIAREATQELLRLLRSALQRRRGET